MLHHVDDAALLRVPRILGIMSKLSSRAISKAGTSRAGAFGEEFDERYNKAVTELRGWITDERLILADQARLIGSLPAHERWIKEIRRRNSHGSFISIGDNFHLFDMPGMEPGEGKVREMSKFIAGLPTKHGITTMFTMELPKDILKPGTRLQDVLRQLHREHRGDPVLGGKAGDELRHLTDFALPWLHPWHVEQVEVVPDRDETAMTVAPPDLFDPALVGRQAADQACLVCQDQTFVGDPATQLGDGFVVALVELLAKSSRARRTGLGDRPAGQLAHDPQNAGNPKQSSVIDVMQHHLQVRIQPQHIDDEIVDEDALPVEWLPGQGEQCTLFRDSAHERVEDLVAGDQLEHVGRGFHLLRSEEHTPEIQSLRHLPLRLLLLNNK